MKKKRTHNKVIKNKNKYKTNNTHEEMKEKQNVKTKNKEINENTYNKKETLITNS